MKFATVTGKDQIVPPTDGSRGQRSLKKMTGAALSVIFLFCLLPLSWGQSRWNIEVIDDGAGSDVGKYSSLAMDPEGNFHVSYYDETHLALWYAFRASGDKRWFKMVVQPKGVGAYNSLAVDAQGRPHISFVSPREDGLHYAFWDGKTWHKSIIDATKADYFNSISLDSKGHPRISYYQYHGPSGINVLHLKYAYFDGQQWYIQTVDSRMSTGKFNSIAVDAQGNPHIAYAHVGLGDLLYAYWNGSEWEFSDADSRRNHNDYVGNGNSIALDSAGRPGIAYFDVSRGSVKYASWDGKTWKAELIAQLGLRGELDRVSLRFDSHDRPHVAFYDAGQGALKVAVRDEQGWHSEVVDHDGNVGFTPSLYLDSQDRAYITYYDLERHALKMAYEASPAGRPTVAEKR